MIAIPILAFISLGAWALSSPVASSPDDDFHLPAIWCGIGDRPGLCESPTGEPTSTDRYVPAAIPTAPCYAFHDTQSGACWNPNQPGMARVTRANIDHLYPPVFYAAMAPLATKNIEASVIAMRFVNAAFIVGVLTAVFFALPRRLRPALLVSALAASVPLGLFLLASTNPSSWAILSAAIVWICCYGALTTEGRRRYVLIGLSILGAVIGGGARADAAIFAVFGAVVAVCLAYRSWRRQRSALIGVVAVIVVSAAFYASARQSGATLGGLGTDAAPLTFAQNVSNFLEVPQLWTGALGSWGLGWLDTTMPAAVWVLTTAVFAGAIFIGLRSASRTKLLMVLLAFTAIWIVPFVMLYLSHATVGNQVQPRYILPLMIILLGVASAPNSDQRTEGGHHLAVGAAALAGTAAIALQFDIRRYTTGVDKHGIDPGSGAEWWWPAAPSPLAVWLIGALAFALMLGLMWWFSRRADGPLLDTTDTVEIAASAGDS
ncbi:DUF2142 domain-containing protein [Microbacterium sp. ASV49]|uniref:DUF2142 domain-containing protein n=1 Tax=Microbacterium candidum TaxID=3041922 RepID=A0ABT7N0T7_9MICO|nr:DUF2142 domain-containing protein [Microbacterium sp. ASV49]MDL9980320.1 DUF2142 domain-containing protein [Microbacterium sp. ASV49]